VTTEDLAGPKRRKRRAKKQAPAGQSGGTPTDPPQAVGTAERAPDSVTIANTAHLPEDGEQAVGTPDDLPPVSDRSHYDP
jgi:hypothetical protein